MNRVAACNPWLERLWHDGYCIIPDLLPAPVINALDADLDQDFEQTPFGQGDFYGHRTKRFGSLLRRSGIARQLVLQPTVLALAKSILEPACERIQLNVAQAIEIHPGEIAQFPHCDHDMWAGVKGSHEYLVNVMWPISRFTELNGATRIYPGTHKRTIGSLDDIGEPVIAECSPGSAICFLGSTVHGAGANRSNNVRRAIVIGYSLGWLKPYENLWLAYPPEIARNFATELAELAGYVQHRPISAISKGNARRSFYKSAFPLSPAPPMHSLPSSRPWWQSSPSRSGPGSESGACPGADLPAPKTWTYGGTLAAGREAGSAEAC